MDHLTTIYDIILVNELFYVAEFTESTFKGLSETCLDSAKMHDRYITQIKIRHTDRRHCCRCTCNDWLNGLERFIQPSLIIEQRSHRAVFRSTTIHRCTFSQRGHRLREEGDASVRKLGELEVHFRDEALGCDIRIERWVVGACETNSPFLVRFLERLHAAVLQTFGPL